MPITARDIIKSALRKISALGSGQALAAEDADDGFQALNAMVGSWSAEGTLVFQTTFELFALTPGKTDYTIGSGQDFNTIRPMRLTSAYYRDASGYDYPLEIIDSERYGTLNNKDLQGRPTFLYYDQNFPVGTIFLYTTPDAGATNLGLYSQKPLVKFADLTTEYEFPEGYERALIYNLAMDLAPEYEREAAPSVMTTAARSKGLIASLNSSKDFMESTLTGIPVVERRVYNIYNDVY